VSELKQGLAIKMYHEYSCASEMLQGLILHCGKPHLHEEIRAEE
jgi:hypothetical protein